MTYLNPNGIRLEEENETGKINKKRTKYFKEKIVPASETINQRSSQIQDVTLIIELEDP